MRNGDQASESPPNNSSDDKASTEKLREAVVAAVHSYQGALQNQLEEYRGQRAWKIMLFLRKAYTQLVRNGWKGRREFITRGLRHMLGGPSDLDYFELTFPDLWNYLPDSLFIPITDRPPNFFSGTEAPTAKPDIFILPPFSFLFRFQRPQQLAVALARSRHRVFWVNPAPAKNADTVTPLRENLWEIAVPGKIDLYEGRLEEEQLARFESTMVEVARSLGVAECWVLVQFPFWRRLALRLRERLGASIVYDCMDDWRHWTAEPKIGSENLIEERSLASECDVLVASSSVLARQLSSDGRQALVVPNAADFVFFNSFPRAPSTASKPTGPVIGYYGALAEWFDVELLASVAKMRPDYSFVLIGHTRDRDLSQLKALPNIKLLGEKNYREIPAQLNEFDVCMIPFSIVEMTKAVDPVKLYEYLSQGKPVVATRLPELEDCSDLLYLAGDPQEFAACIDRALQENSPEIRDRRIAFAEKNTWHHRAASIETAVADALPLVSIIVLTHNSLEFLEPFFRSVVRNTSYPRYELIFVDNNSSDGTRAALQTLSDPRTRVLLNDENVGFARGNNLGARMAAGEYLLFMNPDTLVTNGWLGRLLRPFYRDSSIGVSAPVTNFSGNETRINSDYSTQEEMETFAGNLARQRWGEVRDIPVAPLFCALVPKRVWTEVGELDGRFRVGMFEDDDFSVRVLEHGRRIVSAEDCFIHHFGNGSFAKLPSAKAQQIFEENRAEFERKWKRRWLPHKTRPGVLPPGPQDRMKLDGFVRRAAP